MTKHKLLTLNMQFYAISRLDILDCFIVRAINEGFEQPICCMSLINLYSKGSIESVCNCDKATSTMLWWRDRC